MIYSGPGWEIREGRWQDSPPESVDVVLSDPPYDERTHKGGVRATKGAGHPQNKLVKFVVPFPPLTPEEQAFLTVSALDISKRWVILFCTIEMIGDYQRYSAGGWVRGGIWHRSNMQPQMTGDRPAAFGDAIAIMHRKGRKKWNGHGIPAYWKYPFCSPMNKREDKVHPTQKPIDLILELVRLFSDPGELVWDPYGGSGTTGVACLRLGRRFLMHEEQPHYAEIAAERLRAEEDGHTLQDRQRGQTSLIQRMGDDDG